MRRSLSVLAAAAAGLCLAAPAFAAAPGSPDANFGSGGIIQSGAGVQLFGVASNPDGSVVAAGESGGNIFVEHLSASGAVLNSYTGPAGVARAVTITSTGDVVVAGSSGAAMLVERLTPQLVPDSSFGSGGQVTSFAGQNGRANSVGVASDGSIVAAGSVGTYDTEAAAMRVSASGAIMWSNPLNFGAYSVINGLAIQPADGKIVAVGSQTPSQNTNAVIARLDSNGALDTTFASGQGAFTYYAPGTGYTALEAVALQSNGSIVAAGTSASGPTTIVLRITPGGTLDPSFGSGGVATTAAGRDVTLDSYPIGAYGVAVAPNGEIIAAGNYENTGVQVDGALWAFSSTGAPDSSFANDGVELYPSGTDEACGLSIDSSGRLVTVGDTVPQVPDATPCAVRQYSQGYAARFVGVTTSGSPAPSGGQGAPALKSSLSGLSRFYRKLNAHRGGIGFGVSCNEACKISATVGASSAIAKQLRITTRVRRCRTIHHRRRCTTVRVYRPITAASLRGTLRGPGTLRLLVRSPAFKRAVTAFKHPVTLQLRVVVTSTATNKKVTLTRALTFR